MCWECVHALNACGLQQHFLNKWISIFFQRGIDGTRGHRARKAQPSQQTRWPQRAGEPDSPNLFLRVQIRFDTFRKVSGERVETPFSSSSFDSLLFSRWKGKHIHKEMFLSSLRSTGNMALSSMNGWSLANTRKRDVVWIPPLSIAKTTNFGKASRAL